MTPLAQMPVLCNFCSLYQTRRYSTLTGDFYLKRTLDLGPVSPEKIEPIWRKIVESARNCEQRPQLDVNDLYDTSRGGEAMPTFVNHQCAIIEYWFDIFL